MGAGTSARSRCAMKLKGTTFMRLPNLLATKNGRLVAFFPGGYDAAHNSYRLLGAKDGWGYLATPITA